MDDKAEEFELARNKIFTKLAEHEGWFSKESEHMMITNKGWQNIAEMEKAKNETSNNIIYNYIDGIEAAMYTRKKFSKD